MCVFGSGSFKAGAWWGLVVFLSVHEQGDGEILPCPHLYSRSSDASLCQYVLVLGSCKMEAFAFLQVNSMEPPPPLL